MYISEKMYTGHKTFVREVMQHAAGAADHVAARELVENTCAAENCQVVVPIDKRLRCSRCKKTWYCSKTCQVSAWPLHRIKCKLPRVPVPANRDLYANMTDELQVFVDYYNARSWTKLLELEVKMITHAHTCSEDQRNKDAACQIYQILGAAHASMFNLQSALPLLEKAAQMISDADPPNAIFSPSTITRVYQDLGVVYINVGRVDEALSLFKKLFVLSEGKLCTSTCETLVKMAVCYNLMGRFRKGLSKLQRASDIAREIHDMGVLIQCTLSIAKAYTSLHEYSLAEDSYQLAEEHLKDALGKISSNQSFTYTFDLYLSYGTSEWCRSRMQDKYLQDMHLSPTSPQYIAISSDSKACLNQARDLFFGVLKEYDRRTGQHDLKVLADVHLRLAYLLQNTGDVVEALAHLHGCLDILVDESKTFCTFCYQKRYDEDSMLSCSVCHVSRFCNVECQKMAYKRNKIATGEMVVTHKQLCPLLREWKRVKSGRQSADACKSMFLNFLSDCYPFKELCSRDPDLDSSSV